MKRIMCPAFFVFGMLTSIYPSIVTLRSRLSIPSLLATQKAGLLDTTWATDGSMVYNPGGTTDTCGYVLCSSDGSVFVSGKKDSTAFIAKFDNKGTLKTEFGTSGQLVNSIVTGGFISLALDESTNTLYALGTNTTHSYVFAYNALTGAAITSFSTTLSGQSQATGLAIDATGLYVLVGTGSEGNLYKINLATGALDSQFNNGAVINLTGAFFFTLGIKVRDGFVYVAGTISTNPYTSTVHKRDAITGALIWAGTCNENPFPTNGAYGYNIIAIDSQGSVYFAADDGADTGIYKFDGATGAAAVVVGIGASGLTNFIVAGMLVDQLKGVLLIGTVTGGFGPGRITRLLPGDSGLDSSFASGGTLTNTDMDRTNQFTHAAFDSQGRIMLAGSTSTGNIAIARYTGVTHTGNAQQAVIAHIALGKGRGLTGSVS